MNFKFGKRNTLLIVILICVGLGITSYFLINSQRFSENSNKISQADILLSGQKPNYEPAKITYVSGKIIVVGGNSLTIQALAQDNLFLTDKTFQVLVAKDTKILSTTKPIIKDGGVKERQVFDLAYLKVGDAVYVVSKKNISDNNKFEAAEIYTAVKK
ncbi:MAG: hypothetical protein NTV62_04305 [Candidatus Gribaldobacteria bacterium]|nr:hypothetical protein [Candidatus Gribaldobacteria bacterium]